MKCGHAGPVLQTPPIQHAPVVCFNTGDSGFSFHDADGLLDDGRHDQIVPSLSSPGHASPRSSSDYGGERYSRKVFVGGLPPDIDEGKSCVK